MYLDKAVKQKFFYIYIFKYKMKKLIYNRYMGELWLWMIFLEWIYYSIKNTN